MRTFSGFPGLVLFGALSCGAGLAQQAPLPPGTTADARCGPRHGNGDSATPLAEAESDIALQNYDGARKLLLPWISAHPADARAVFDLGYLEDAQNHPEAAIASYRKAIEVDPKLFEARLSLGLLLARQGDAVGAQEQLTAAIALQPNPPNPGAQAQAFRALARLERTTDPAAAKQHLVEALRLGPEQPEDVLLTAEIAAANGDDETAEAAYRRAAGEAAGILGSDRRAGSPAAEAEEIRRGGASATDGDCPRSKRSGAQCTAREHPELRGQRGRVADHPREAAWPAARRPVDWRDAGRCLHPKLELRRKPILFWSSC